MQLISLFLDNWYSSPPLFRLLRDHSTPTCGTVRKKRAQFPPEFLNRICQCEWCYAWCEVARCFLLSTFHRPKMVATRKTDRSGNAVMKDHVLAHCNLVMGFVDKNDAITTQHTMVRKSNKWTTKVALHLIEESLFNAHILYGLSSENNPMKYSNFKLACSRAVDKSTEGSGFDKANTYQHFPKSVR